MINDTRIDNPKSIASSTDLDDLLVVSFWTTLLIYGFITNTLTLIGICRSRKMRQATSYWIVASLAICDWFMIIVCFVHIIPATYLHESFVEIQSQQTVWAMFLYNVFWYSGVIQLAAMAVNRFVSIVFPLHYKRIFAPHNTLVILIVLYLLGLLASVPTLHECCYIVYDYHNYVTYYWPVDSEYMWLDIFINTFSVSTMIVCYAAILFKVRKSSLRRRRYQLAAKAGAASGVVLLVSAAAAAVRSNSTTTTTTPLLIKNDDDRKRKITLLKPDWPTIKLRLSKNSVFHKSADPLCKKQSIANDFHSQSVIDYNDQSIIDCGDQLIIDGNNRSIIDCDNRSTMDCNDQSVYKKSITSDCKSQSFTEYPNYQSIDRSRSIDIKKQLIADHRRRSITSPNLLTCTTTDSNDNNTSHFISTSQATSCSITDDGSPPTQPVKSESSTAQFHLKHCSALAASLQQKQQPDQNQQATRREIRLFVQFFVVSLVFLSTWVTWQWLPRISNASKWVYFATTTFFFINNAVNPTVYLIFNSGLRHQVKAIVSCRWTKKLSRKSRVKNGKYKPEMASTTGGGKGGTRMSSSSD